MPGLSRASLIGVLATLAAWSAALPDIDPHMDPELVPGQCRACHAGHGESGSPMLRAVQVEVCFACHGTENDRDRMIAEGVLAQSVRPQLMAATLAEAFAHPISEGAYSRHEANVVTCTSCHSPHRGNLGRERLRGAEPAAAAGRKLSPRDPARFEFEMCAGCHGDDAAPRGNLQPAELFDVSNRSYHPVEAPVAGSSPSVLPEWAGREINCTDCHGNDDDAAVRGPHASGVRYLLSKSYTAVDGQGESELTYELCYACHDRQRVLESTSFPGHGRHVAEYRASCATCHSAHGSLDNRALIRFGEERDFSGVEPSIEAGILAFESNAPGSGSCYVTCHGFDHAPESYGVGGIGIDPRAVERDDRGLSTISPR
jgi:predicted CXXCH cytochrome family protein